MIRLYIIDDHYLVIEGLYSSFDMDSDDFKVVGGSLIICEALQKISAESVDIIILDLFILQSDPALNFTRIHNAFPSVPIVILTYDNSLLWKVKMFQLGAKASINKAEDKSVMRQKLPLVAKGETLIPEDVAQIMISGPGILPERQSITDHQKIITYLANGMSTKEIAGKLNQSESYIEKKLQKIREYFHVNTNCELVYKASSQKLPNLFL